jgi:transcription elongation factor Elf1
LPCCGQVYGKDGLNTTHECSKCNREEHIHCSTSKTNRRKAWVCSNCM